MLLKSNGILVYETTTKNLHVTTTNPNSLHIVSRGVVIGNWMSFCNLKSINNQ